MNYAIISCVERDINLEAVCGTREEAIEKMKECFLDFHSQCGHSPIDVNAMKLNIEEYGDVEDHYYGFDRSGHAWSNEIKDCHYDIKILKIK